MSTYNRITRHPNNGKYYNATWHDDYFGRHVYGVEFPNDGVVYPVDMVDKARLKEFWADDVIAAFQKLCAPRGDIQLMTTTFLNAINDAYKERWKQDPTDGDGAVDNLMKKRDKDD